MKASSPQGGDGDCMLRSAGTSVFCFACSSFACEGEVFFMVLIQLKDVSVHFGTRKVLDRLDLTIREGERLGLVG